MTGSWVGNLLNRLIPRTKYYRECASIQLILVIVHFTDYTEKYWNVAASQQKQCLLQWTDKIVGLWSSTLQFIEMHCKRIHPQILFCAVMWNTLLTGAVQWKVQFTPPRICLELPVFDPLVSGGKLPPRGGAKNHPSDQNHRQNWSELSFWSAHHLIITENNPSDQKQIILARRFQMGIWK